MHPDSRHLLPFFLAAALMGPLSCRSPGPRSQPAVAIKKTPPVAKLAPAPTGLSRYTIYYEGRLRYYLLYVPEVVHNRHDNPLIIALHGGGGIPEEMMNMSGFNHLADTEGAVVVYPSGTGSTPRRLFWNILKSDTYASLNRIDDLTFVGMVLDEVIARVSIDPKCVFASGFSQGGMLCYRIACDTGLSARIAAIAVVGATMTVNPSECMPARPIPLISFHGMEDPFSNYAGGIAEKAPRNDQVPRPGLDASIQQWVKKTGLSETPFAAGSRGAADMKQYGPGTDGCEVVSWVLRDGGHTWPGSNNNLPEWMMGKVNRDIDATRLIWDFFSRHQL